jgi:hypothetical protein
MKGKTLLYIDQYGQKYLASTIKELKKEVSPYGNLPVSKMYRDKKNGTTVHVGYIVGQHWCTAYQPVEITQ